MKYVLVFLFFLHSIPLVAQEETPSSFSIGYYGDVVFNPGMRLAYDGAVKNWESSKGPKAKALLIGAELNYYFNRKTHHAFILGPTFSFKRTKINGRFVQFKWLSGVHQSLVDGMTYQFSEGVLEEKRWNGQSTWYNSLSFGFGRKLSTQLAYYAEFGVNARYPFNHALLPGIHLSIGIQYLLQK